LLNDGRIDKNLSLNFPGENLFPKVHIRGERFCITWIYYQDNKVNGCFFDSLTGLSQKVAGEGFHFLSTPEVVFRGSQPLALVFLANKGDKKEGEEVINDNDDIYVYHLETRRLVNVTQTPENEKVFSFMEGNRGFTLKTETLDYHAVYTVRFPGLRVVSREKQAREVEAVYPPQAVTSTAYNTLVAFGDSITWGKIRMSDLQGEYHPDLAYLGLIQNYLAENYRSLNAVNLGIPGDTTYDGIERLKEDFTGVEGYFCMIMFGTNDVGQNSFSSSSSVENLEWMCEQIRDKYGMYPIISTIPPMTHISGEQYLKEASEELNRKIKKMAEELEIPCVDTYAAFFMEPDWEILVEDIIGNHVVGNHPSPAGHQIIAQLFLYEILKLPPRAPGDFQTWDTDTYRLLAQWTANYEFDFSHYVIEFGYAEDNLNRSFEIEENYFTFIRSPFQLNAPSYIYFRVRAWDKAGYSSGVSDTMRVEFK